jgi:hypothetical protein
MSSDWPMRQASASRHRLSLRSAARTRYGSGARSFCA